MYVPEESHSGILVKDLGVGTGGLTYAGKYLYHTLYGEEK
jgi:hypothetical protein